MFEIDPGHIFHLKTLDGAAQANEYLHFVKRVGVKYPGNRSRYPGTTSQEVLRALIARAKYVNRQTPCWETRLSIWLFRAAIFLYEWRAKHVKGKRLLLRGFTRIEHEPTCAKCGHIRCTEVHRLKETV